MQIKIIFPILILISLFFDSTFLSLPIVFALCLGFYILDSSLFTIVFTFFISVLLDMLKVNQVGLSASILMFSFLIIYFFRKVFETQDLRVLLIVPFFLTYIYGSIQNYGNNLWIYVALFLAFLITITYFIGQKKPFVAEGN